MNALAALRDLLLDQREPEKILRLADKHLRRMAEDGGDFILPREHKAVLPILEFYAGDLAGWVKFVKGVRDRLESKSAAQVQVHVFYRMLLIRLVQQQRRERIEAGVAMAVKKRLISNDYDAKVAYGRKLVQQWMVRRQKWLAGHRRDTEQGRLSTDVREELLQEFWGNIDKEIKNGELPKP